MIANQLKIGHIPAVLWGENNGSLILAVHGSRSSKIDDCIWILAEETVKRGYQVLSFDLPQHGERVYNAEPCKVQACCRELKDVFGWARQYYQKISVFGCSMGAYCCLLAYADERIEKAWFLSPVIHMQRVIHSIMDVCKITEKKLQELQTVPNPLETLYWDDYIYVREHPVRAWPHPTCILRGETDELCSRESIEAFAERFDCILSEQPGGEHWFHTPEQLEYFRNWLKQCLSPSDMSLEK